MRSRHVDDFNHDEWAAGYDGDVSDEGDPIRTGYRDLLDWVIRKADIHHDKEVLELGSGTGNLTCLIRECKRILCVDISEKMEALAAPKTTHLKNREFRKSDILQIFDEPLGSFDAVISTYTIHHLLDKEKAQFFKEIWKILREGGTAVFGDLMFENETEKLKILQHCRASGREELASDIEEEFFWNMDTAITELQAIGFSTHVKRFSELSFGISAAKP